MPIDSSEKRRAASKLLKFKPGVTPNAAHDAEWRQQAGRSYSGFTLQAPPAVSDHHASVGRAGYRHRFRNSLMNYLPEG